jgi:hypothetical protein
MTSASPLGHAAPLVPRLFPAYVPQVAVVVDDAAQGPHVGQVGPQSVALGHVRGVQLAGAGGPEVFARVVQGEDV